MRLNPLQKPSPTIVMSIEDGSWVNNASEEFPEVTVLLLDAAAPGLRGFIGGMRVRQGVREDDTDRWFVEGAAARAGYGPLLYDVAARAVGAPISPSETQSSHAQRFWGRLPGGRIRNLSDAEFELKYGVRRIPLRDSQIEMAEILGALHESYGYGIPLERAIQTVMQKRSNPYKAVIPIVRGIAYVPNPKPYKDLPLAVALRSERIDESRVVPLAPGVSLITQISRTGKRVPVTHGEQRLFLWLQDDQGRSSLFYQSFAGTGGKEQGIWFPSGGVAADAHDRGVWIIKGNPKTDPGAGRVPLLEFYERVNAVLPHSDQDTDAFLTRMVGMDYEDFAFKDEFEIQPTIKITESGFANALQNKWSNWIYQFWALNALDKTFGKRTFNMKSNPVDLEGRFVPEKYLAGLPPALQKQRIRELTQSRDAYKKGDYSELPTDRAARKMGLVKQSKYTTEAKKRGIEYRGDLHDMASRVLRYYGARATPSEVSVFAGALKKSFSKGLAAWKSGGHRPGATAQNWAVARVNSLVVGGKTSWTADKKLFEVLPAEVRAKIESMRTKQNPIRVSVEGAPSGSEAPGRHTRFYQSRAALDRIEEQGREVVPDIKFRIVWGHKDIAPMRQKGGIQHERGERDVVTLVADASRTQRLSDANEKLGLSVGRAGKVTLYTAHTILHRLGDMIMPSFRDGYTTMNYDARVSGGVKAGLIVTDRVERAWRNLHTALDKARSYLTMGAIPVEYWFVTAVDTKACRERWVNDATQALAETVPYRLLYKKGREQGVKLLSDLPFVPALEAALTEYIDASMEMLKGYLVEI